MTGRELPEEFLDGYAEVLADVARTGRRLNREELQARRVAGERAAEAGHSLRVLVNAHLTVARAAWPRSASAPADSALAALAQAVDALAGGYERAQHLAVRQEEAARREFIDDLLFGGSDLGRLAERAERFGLRLSHAHAVAVAEGSQAYAEADPVARRVQQALVGRFGDRQLLLTTKEGRLICIAPGDATEVLECFVREAQQATGGVRVAVGRTHGGAGGIVQSYEEALNALELAERMGLGDPVLYAADLLVYPVLTRDREAMADLVRSALGPLRTARGGAGPLLETLAVYFDSGCIAAEAARRLSLSVRALTYRLARVHQLTGADPSDPVHRYTLHTAVIGARLLDWPAQEL
ncbi:PucR family transcriptional regulator [Streptomyces sp. NPDC093097]|uniref:PucR family transcriptional regulator n=1 Tax=Streptomyces sp. NPDC093097 TaxID=3366027 RepID=UPI003808A1F4